MFVWRYKIKTGIIPNVRRHSILGIFFVRLPSQFVFKILLDIGRRIG